MRRAALGFALGLLLLAGHAEAQIISGSPFPFPGTAKVNALCIDVANGDTGLGRQSAGLFVITNCSTTNFTTLGSGGITLRSGDIVGFSSSATDATVASDTSITRNAAGFGGITTGWRVADGTGAAPTYSFASETTTGFHRRTTAAISIDFAGGRSFDIAQSAGVMHFFAGSTGLIGFTSGTDPGATGGDTAIARNAAGVLEVNSGTAGTLRDITVRNALPNAPIVTAASGTGVTVNDVGSVQRVRYKVTATNAAFPGGAKTGDLTIATLQAGQRLVSIVEDVTTTFSGGGETAATMTCGKTAGGNEYLVSFSVFTAAITRGLADGDLGTSINRANAIQGGDLPSWTATTAITCRLTTTTNNISGLTQGSATWYLITEQVK